MTKEAPLEFDNMPDAFAVCRERSRPLYAKVSGLLWKFYPSGRAEEVRAERERKEAGDGRTSPVQEDL